MNDLGISKRNGCIYEGEWGNGIPVLGNPLILPVSFVSTDCKLSGTDALGLPNHIFREDFFDPITKVRRGRIYRAGGNQPVEWRVQDSRRSDLKLENWSDGTAQKVELISYQHDSLTYLREISTYPEVILGKEPFISIWKIISIESSISDTPVLTLKSYRSFGSIPKLLPNVVPSDILQKLVSALDKVENSSNRLGPLDIIDRCRDVLSIIFGQLCGELSKDLGKAIEAYVKTLDKNRDNLMSWAGRIVARLHSRGKPNEQHKIGLNESTEEEAQLALRCLWLVLVELGWATNN
jgi:hypothetical protein